MHLEEHCTKIETMFHLFYALLFLSNLVFKFNIVLIGIFFIIPTTIYLLFCFLINIWDITDLEVYPVRLRFFIRTSKILMGLGVPLWKVFSSKIFLSCSYCFMKNDYLITAKNKADICYVSDKLVIARIVIYLAQYGQYFPGFSYFAFISLKRSLLFNSSCCLFLFVNKTLRLNNFMNAKISVFVIFVEAVIYLLLYNLHDCTFNNSLISLCCARAGDSRHVRRTFWMLIDVVWLMLYVYVNVRSFFCKNKNHSYCNFLCLNFPFPRCAKFALFFPIWVINSINISIY